MTIWDWIAIAPWAAWVITLELRVRDLQARQSGLYVTLGRSIDECMSRHPAGRKREQR